MVLGTESLVKVSTCCYISALALTLIVSPGKFFVIQNLFSFLGNQIIFPKIWKNLSLIFFLYTPDEIKKWSIRKWKPSLWIDLFFNSSGLDYILPKNGFFIFNNNFQKYLLDNQLSKYCKKIFFLGR